MARRRVTTLITVLLCKIYLLYEKRRANDPVSTTGLDDSLFCIFLLTLQQPRGLADSYAHKNAHRDHENRADRENVRLDQRHRRIPAEAEKCPDRRSR